MKGHCGLVDPDASCRCHLRIKPAVKKGRVDPGHLLFTAPKQFRDDDSLKQEVGEMEELHEVASLYRTQPEYDAPEVLLEEIRKIIDSDSYEILN